jgi:hypothetical protein
LVDRSGATEYRVVRPAQGEVSVPLAHQSALAGILLASWVFIDRVPELRALRPAATQARYDVLRGAKQIAPRKRGRAPRCMCSDLDFLEAYEARWGANVVAVTQRVQQEPALPV